MTDLFKTAVERFRTALKAHGYEIEMETSVNENRNLIYTVSTHFIMEAFFYCKFEQQPLKHNTAFPGAGITINADMVNEYIRPHEMDILYYYAMKDKIFYCNYVDFMQSSVPYTQPYNEEKVRIYEYKELEQW